MPKRVCLGSAQHPRCGNYAEVRGRCRRCYRALERERSRRRRETTKGVYKKRIWAMRRKQAIERDPFCSGVEDGVRCDRLGEELDHIVPLDRGGAAYAATNLQLLCTEHHRLKTAQENAQRASESAGRAA